MTKQEKIALIRRYIRGEDITQPKVFIYSVGVDASPPAQYRPAIDHLITVVSLKDCFDAVTGEWIISEDHRKLITDENFARIQKNIILNAKEKT